jgi:hypothetical protein
MLRFLWGCEAPIETEQLLFRAYYMDRIGKPLDEIMSGIVQLFVFIMIP